MLQSLERMGYAQGEVIDSTPLVSTRAIDMLMRDLFALDPHTVLLVARVIEAVDFDEAQGEEFGIDVANHYGLPSDALAPFLAHVRIDASLGHGRMLEDHADLLSRVARERIHAIVNGLHDLKHAFDLQKLEIKDYYGHAGNYIPRQFVSYFAI